MKKIVSIALLATLSLSIQADAQVIYNSSGRNNNPISYRSVKGAGHLDRLIYAVDLSSLNPYFFGNAFQIGFRPSVGYQFTDFLTAGISLSYLYFSQRNVYPLTGPNGNIVYKPYRYHNYAAGLWTRATVFQNIFLHAEYERNLLRRVGYQNVGPNIVKIEERDWVNCILVGGGLIQRIGQKSFITTTILYDVLQNSNANMRPSPSGVGPAQSISPYAGRIEYRFGINFGL